MFLKCSHPIFFLYTNIYVFLCLVLYCFCRQVLTWTNSHFCRLQAIPVHCIAIKNSIFEALSISCVVLICRAVPEIKAYNGVGTGFRYRYCTCLAFVYVLVFKLTVLVLVTRYLLSFWLVLVIKLKPLVFFYEDTWLRITLFIKLWLIISSIMRFAYLYTMNLILLLSIVP
jgi:hypothetical protein